MVPRWFVSKNKQKLGPYSATQLKTLAQRGQLTNKDLVLKEGTAQWVQAGTIKGLFTSNNVQAAVNMAVLHAPHTAAKTGGVVAEKRFWTIGKIAVLVLFLCTGVLFLTSSGAAGWFWWQSQHFQNEVTKWKKKVDEPRTTVTRRPAGDDVKKQQEVIDKLRADLKDLEKKYKDLEADGSTPSGGNGDIARLRRELQQYEQKSRLDALALAQLTKSIAAYKQQLDKRFTDEVKTQLTLLDKSGLKDQAKLLALRKKLGLPVSGDVPVELIDAFAMAAPKEAEQSVTTLAQYLTAPFTTENEKTRAIFRWITDRISYDVQSLNPLERKNQDADTVLANRMGVCAGYSNLFDRLCQLNKIQSIYVGGFGKGAGWRPGMPIKRNHAWNAVRIDGQWHLLDCTWAAGHLKNGQFIKKFNNTHYLVPPELMVLNHLPDDSKWQLLPQPLTKQDLQPLLNVDQRLLVEMADLGAPPKELLQRVQRDVSFRGNLAKVKGFHVSQLKKLGALEGANLLEVFRNPKFGGLVKAYRVPDGVMVRIRKVPVQKTLAAGFMLEVELEATGIHRAGVVQNRRVQSMVPKGNKYIGRFILQPGIAKIVVFPKDQTNRYFTILEYQVTAQQVLFQQRVRAQQWAARPFLLAV